MTSRTGAPSEVLRHSAGTSTASPGRNALGSQQTATRAPHRSVPGATRCAHCGAVEDWGKASWCPRCGFYPAVGKCVALDQTAPFQQGPASLDDLFPVWARVLAFGAGVIIVVNLWLRLGVLGDDERAWWALGEAGVGLLMILVAHSAAFLYGATKSDASSPFDFCLRPIALWKPAIRALPEKAWRVWTMGWGLSVAISALVIIGGIRYSAIFDDWGFAKRAQPSIIQAVVDQARQEREGAESLEDAMNDFTGEPGEDESLKNMSRADCLIFGYTVNPQGEVRGLLLAGVVDSQLKYVGKLSFKELPPETASSIQGRFLELERKRSFIKVPFAAKWLEPRLMCTIAYAGWGDDRLMRHPRFLQLLADAKR